MNTNGLYWWMIDEGLINPSREEIQKVYNEVKKNHIDLQNLKLDQAKKDFKLYLFRDLEQNLTKSALGDMVRKRLIKKHIDII